MDLPTSLPSVHDLVAEDLESRKSLGLQTYGRLLTKDSPEDMLVMAYEEVLDLACYLRTEIEKRQDKAPEPLSVPDTPRGAVTEKTPSVSTWRVFMLYTLIPDYLQIHGGIDAEFTMNELKAFMEANSQVYPYVDTNKRMSSAITELHEQGYFYHPSRYKWAATAKFAELFLRTSNSND